MYFAEKVDGYDAEKNNQNLLQRKSMTFSLIIRTRRALETFYITSETKAFIVIISYPLCLSTKTQSCGCFQGVNGTYLGRELHWSDGTETPSLVWQKTCLCWSARRDPIQGPLHC